MRFKAVIFDWAGTMIDFGSFAPAQAFMDAFASFGVKVSLEEARQPMGLPKRDHIKAMMAVERITETWEEAVGSRADDKAIDQVYNAFLPINEAIAGRFSDLVPGAKKTVDHLRSQGIKIGSTTGYTRSIMAHVLPIAATQGYAPDNLVCSDDLIEGRPGPLAMYQCFVDLAVYPPRSVIKVDDTAPGIAEGTAAGCVTIGVTLSGNYVGKSVQEIESLSTNELECLRSSAKQKLEAAGANYTIDTVADLPRLLDRLIC